MILWRMQMAAQFSAQNRVHGVLLSVLSEEAAKSATKVWWLPAVAVKRSLSGLWMSLSTAPPKQILETARAGALSLPQLQLEHNLTQAYVSEHTVRLIRSHLLFRARDQFCEV